MPAYFNRFPERDSLHTKFWHGRPRNPCCGIMSLETGTKIFCWYNLITGVLGVLVGFLLFAAGLFLHHAQTEDMIHTLKTSPTTTVVWVKEHNLTQYIATKSIIAAVFVCIIDGCLCFAVWNLKKAVVVRDVPQMKKYFWSVAVVLLVAYILQFFEWELIWAGAWVFEIFILAIDVTGLLYTHSFIVSVIMAEHGQPEDDTNRIHFNA